MSTMPVRVKTTAEILEQLDAINAAIKRWKDRPIPTDGIYSNKLRPEPSRKSFGYFDGRFYEEADIFAAFCAAGCTGAWPEFIRAAHERLYGRCNEKAREVLEIMIADHERGGPLPPFVYAIYRSMKDNGRT